MHSFLTFKTDEIVKRVPPLKMTSATGPAICDLCCINYTQSRLVIEFPVPIQIVFPRPLLKTRHRQLDWKIRFTQTPRFCLPINLLDQIQKKQQIRNLIELSN